MCFPLLIRWPSHRPHLRRPADYFDLQSSQCGENLRPIIIIIIIIVMGIPTNTAPNPLAHQQLN